jgi:hypothetical protein
VGLWVLSQRLQVELPWLGLDESLNSSAAGTGKLQVLGALLPLFAYLLLCLLLGRPQQFPS